MSDTKETKTGLSTKPKINLFFNDKKRLSNIIQNFRNLDITPLSDFKIYGIELQEWINKCDFNEKYIKRGLTYAELTEAILEYTELYDKITKCKIAVLQKFGISDIYYHNVRNSEYSTLFESYANLGKKLPAADSLEKIVDSSLEDNKSVRLFGALLYDIFINLEFKVRHYLSTLREVAKIEQISDSDKTKGFE